MNNFDLQIQTSTSDGAYAPRELVKRAKDLGLKTVAITDHDTVAGASEMLTAGEDYGIEVIPGIEISAADDRIFLHILGFGVDHENLELLGVLEEARQGRIHRAQEVVKRLQGAGFHITYEDVLRYAKGPSVGRPHIAQAVLANSENKKLLGDISDIGGFIRAYLVPGKDTYVGHEHISVHEAVDMIHHASGVAIWSHPAIHGIDSEKLEEMLKKFISYGMDGIEVFNPSQTEEQVRFLQSLAEKYSLLRSAGSDFHTDKIVEPEHEGGAELASFPTYGIDVSDIVPRVKEAIARRRKGGEASFG